ncbi:hypothetical protein WA1_23955 [Scytonema hofmannii PCC 7110]|uniref:Uncharacterized protein n=1 Tax=Scytonema hofmannii PCC 7110 TaxID=128403 RepID=A0A139X7M2_9CYAN|nr:hypothetical protein WA1_23955 [Scytonema hofmannii PCC 7110]
MENAIIKLINISFINFASRRPQLAYLNSDYFGANVFKKPSFFNFLDLKKILPSFETRENFY